VLAGEATISQLGTLTEADTAASVNETPPESDTSTDTCSPWDGHLPEPECSLIPRLHWDVRDADIPTYTEAGIAQYGRSLDTGTYACEPVLVAPRYPFSPTETLPSYTQYAQTQPYVPESPLRVWEVDEGRLLMDVHRFWSYMEHLMPTTEDIALQVDDFTAPKTPQDRPWGASWYFGSGNPYRFNLPNIFTHTELATPPVPSTTATVEAFKARVLQMLDDRQQALQETITAENAITQAELAATRTIEWPAIYRETLFEPWLKTAWEQYQDATHLGDLSYTPADVEMHCSYARTEEKLTRDEAYQYKRMDADAIAAYEALTQSAPDITAVTWIESCWLVDAANNYAKVSPTASESSLEYITQYYELHPLVPYYDANALAEDIDFRLLKEALEWIQTPIDEKNVFVLQSLSLAHQGE
ncbi:MAG: hypothetical protein KC910_36650, partial [Candidatus Eremiobacteraeota bacterium]|nr:hypothetical protein [Candidatus Eremiobacteraeota bacterium]